MFLSNFLTLYHKSNKDFDLFKSDDPKDPKFVPIDLIVRKPNKRGGGAGIPVESLSTEDIDTISEMIGSGLFDNPEDLGQDAEEIDIVQEDETEEEDENQQIEEQQNIDKSFREIFGGMTFLDLMESGRIDDNGFMVVDIPAYEDVLEDGKKTRKQIGTRKRIIHVEPISSTDMLERHVKEVLKEGSDDDSENIGKVLKHSSEDGIVFLMTDYGDGDNPPTGDEIEGFKRKSRGFFAVSGSKTDPNSELLYIGRPDEVIEGMGSALVDELGLPEHANFTTKDTVSSKYGLEMRFLKSVEDLLKRTKTEAKKEGIKSYISENVDKASVFAQPIHSALSHDIENFMIPYMKMYKYLGQEDDVSVLKRRTEEEPGIESDYDKSVDGGFFTSKVEKEAIDAFIGEIKNHLSGIIDIKQKEIFRRFLSKRYPSASKFTEAAIEFHRSRHPEVWQLLDQEAVKSGDVEVEEKDSSPTTTGDEGLELDGIDFLEPEKTKTKEGRARIKIAEKYDELSGYLYNQGDGFLHFKPVRFLGAGGNRTTDVLRFGNFFDASETERGAAHVYVSPLFNDFWKNHGENITRLWESQFSKQEHSLGEDYITKSFIKGLANEYGIYSSIGPGIPSRLRRGLESSEVQKARETLLRSKKIKEQDLEKQIKEKEAEIIQRFGKNIGAIKSLSKKREFIANMAEYSVINENLAKIHSDIVVGPVMDHDITKLESYDENKEGILYHSEDANDEVIKKTRYIYFPTNKNEDVFEEDLEERDYKNGVFNKKVPYLLLTRDYDLQNKAVKSLENYGSGRHLDARGFIEKNVKGIIERAKSEGFIVSKEMSEKFAEEEHKAGLTGYRTTDWGKNLDSPTSMAMGVLSVLSGKLLNSDWENSVPVQELKDGKLVNLLDDKGNIVFYPKARDIYRRSITSNEVKNYDPITKLLREHSFGAMGDNTSEKRRALMKAFLHGYYDEYGNLMSSPISNSGKTMDERYVSDFFGKAHEFYLKSEKEDSENVGESAGELKVDRIKPVFDERYYSPIAVNSVIGEVYLNMLKRGEERGVNISIEEKHVLRKLHRETSDRMFEGFVDLAKKYRAANLEDNFAKTLESVVNKGIETEFTSETPKSTGIQFSKLTLHSEDPYYIPYETVSGFDYKEKDPKNKDSSIEKRQIGISDIVLKYFPFKSLARGDKGKSEIREHKENYEKEYNDFIQKEVNRRYSSGTIEVPEFEEPDNEDNNKVVAFNKVVINKDIENRRSLYESKLRNVFAGIYDHFQGINKNEDFKILKNELLNATISREVRRISELHKSVEKNGVLFNPFMLDKNPSSKPSDILKYWLDKSGHEDREKLSIISDIDAHTSKKKKKQSTDIEILSNEYSSFFKKYGERGRSAVLSFHLGKILDQHYNYINQVFTSTSHENKSNKDSKIEVNALDTAVRTFNNLHEIAENIHNGTISVQETSSGDTLTGLVSSYMALHRFHGFMDGLNKEFNTRKDNVLSKLSTERGAIIGNDKLKQKEKIDQLTMFEQKRIKSIKDISRNLFIERIKKPIYGNENQGGFSTFKIIMADLVAGNIMKAGRLRRLSGVAERMAKQTGENETRKRLEAIGVTPSPTFSSHVSSLGNTGIEMLTNRVALETRGVEQEEVVPQARAAAERLVPSTSKGFLAFDLIKSSNSNIDLIKSQKFLNTFMPRIGGIVGNRIFH